MSSLTRHTLLGYMGHKVVVWSLHMVWKTECLRACIHLERLSLGLEVRPTFARRLWCHTHNIMVLMLAVLLITPLVRDYLLNYARSLIYTTSLSYANIIAADCSFDLLEEGEAGKVSRPVLSLRIADSSSHSCGL